MPKAEQRQHILAPPSIQCSVNNNLQSPFFAIGDWPQEDWWTIFNSPQLDEMMCIALHNNPTLQEAKQRIEIAKQESIIVRSRLFPLVYFEATDIESYLSKNGLYKALNPALPLHTTLIDLLLSFKYEFDFWGKNCNLFRAALGKKFAETAEARQVWLMISTAVAQAYFALKTDLLRQALYVKLYEIRSNIFQLQNLLQGNALSSRLEPLVIEANVLEAEKFILDIEAQIEIDKHLINVLMGRSPDCPLCIDAELPGLPQKIAIPCDVSLNLLSRRPDLMARIWRAKAIAYEVGTAIADFYPDINLSGLVGLESVSFSKLFEPGSFTASATPALYLPIFTACAIEANVKAKKAAFNEAVYAYNQLLLQSAQEVADLLYLANSIFGKKVEQDQIIDTVRENYDLAVLRREKGLDSKFSDYRIAEILISKELDEAALIYDQYVAVIKLIKALGGGYWAGCVPLKARS
jgi:NodT family efflux transporter outer membrane factor (OMF) lipoprotein